MRLNGVPRIDTLILTAVDMGHARDLPQLMENVRVEHILIPSGCTETAKNMELLRLCEQYQAEEISEPQSIIGAAAPVSVFPVAEGKLGVEGMRPEVILDALRRAGATFEGEGERAPAEKMITKADFFEWGLSGRPDSAARRAAVLKALDLPQHMTANALLEFINAVGTRQQLCEILQSFSSGD